MRVNLQLHGNSPYLPDAQNIDTFPVANSPQEVKPGAIDNLDWLVDTGEVNLLVANDVIDYQSLDVKQPILANWISKLAHGGVIVLGGVDLYEVSHAFSNDALPLEQATLLLYGPPDFPFGTRKHTTSLEDIVRFIETSGLKVISKRIQNFRWIIEAQRQ